MKTLKRSKSDPCDLQGSLFKSFNVLETKQAFTTVTKQLPSNARRVKTTYFPCKCGQKTFKCGLGGDSTNFIIL